MESDGLHEWAKESKSCTGHNSDSDDFANDLNKFYAHFMIVEILGVSERR